MSVFQPQIVLLPGMGADDRLFAAQREAFPNLTIPSWIAAKVGEGLADYGERLAAEIPVARPLLLGGCSLGGMIAYEMAHVLRPDALVLIASAATRTAIPFYFRALARISWIVPTAGYRLSGAVSQLIGPVFGGKKVEHRRLMIEMLHDTSPDFLRWSCMAVGRWQPRPLAGVRTFFVHGDNDWVLPLGNRPAEFVVRDAGHLLTVTHGEEVNAALQKIVAGMIIELPSLHHAELNETAPQ